MRLKQTTVICNIKQIEFESLLVIIQLKVYHCGGLIYRGWAFLPPLKFIKSFYFYVIIYFMTKISVYQELDMFLVTHQF